MGFDFEYEQVQGIKCILLDVSVWLAFFPVLSSRTESEAEGD